MTNDNYIIEMLNITKKFGPLYANKNLTLQLKNNEILALLGENGAGKSTLMSILFGLYQPDEGSIKKNGKIIEINNPNDATDLHIGMVHQHFKLIDKYTILDNIILGNEPIKQIKLEGKCLFFKKIINYIYRKILKPIDHKTAKEEIDKIIKKYNLNVDLDAKVEDVSVETQQKVEIIKILYRKNDILIFDEPTAVLTEQETKDFLQILLTLKKEGKSIIFISHKLPEIISVADRVEVIRKGELIAVKEKSETNEEELSTLMVGRKVVLPVNNWKTNFGKEVLRVENVSYVNKATKKTVVKNVSFNIRQGEIVCIAGVDGNGQQELIYGLMGLEKFNTGEIFINGIDVTNYSIRNRATNGMATIPEDRHKHGLVLDYSLAENLVLVDYFKEPFSKYGLLNFKEINNYADEMIKKYDIRSAEGAKSIARSMSGGNQQKAIIGREIEQNSDLLIAVQPTRGLDIGAIENIHKQLLEIKNSGKAILLVSLEMTEVLSLADRILVMYDGEITGEVEGKQATSEMLGLYMGGIKHDEIHAIK